MGRFVTGAQRRSAPRAPGRPGSPRPVPARPGRPRRPPSPGPRPSPRPAPVRGPSRAQIAAFRRYARRALNVARPFRITPAGFIIGVAADVLLGLWQEWQQGGLNPAASGFTRCGHCGNPRGDITHVLTPTNCSSGQASQTACNFANNCLAGQAVGSACTPTSSTRSFYTKGVYPVPGGERAQVLEVWTRPNTGPLTYDTPRPAVSNHPSVPLYGPWPVEIPLPVPYWLPGALPAPTPLPVPAPLVPYRPGLPDYAPRGVPGRRVGNQPFGVGAIEWAPSWALQVSPSVRTMPTPRPNPRPRDKAKENKWRPKTGAIALALRPVLEGALEGVEIIDILFKALPASIRRGVAPSDRARKIELIKDNWRRLDPGQVACGLAENWAEDRAYGAWGQLLAKQGRGGVHGHQLGIQSQVASRRDRRFQLLSNQAERLDIPGANEFREWYDENRRRICGHISRSSRRRMPVVNVPGSH